MPPEIPDEFIELLERLEEGDLDESGRARLVTMLRDDPRLQTVTGEHFAVGRGLSQLGRDQPGFVERTAAHVAKVAGEGELLAFARKVSRRIVRRRIAKGLAIAAVLALAVVPLMWRDAPASPPVATLVRVDPETGAAFPQPVPAGTRLDEESGLLRLDFASGAVVAIEAPAKLTVVSAMEIVLDSGRLNAWCPDSAHGFRVRTGATELTDLGTSFGVVASGSGSAEFVVLDGSVEVAKGDDRVQLGQGDALATEGGGDPLHSAPFDPLGYKSTWSLANGILSTRGAVIPADPDIPEKVALMESDDQVLVIPERRAVPFTFSLGAEIVAPGALPGDFDDSIKTLQPDSDKRLSSFLIRYNPVGTWPEDHFIRFEGEVTFDRPVLAIAAREQALESSDPMFATASWDEVFRGIELAQINNPPDSVTLSEDRRTVKVVFYAGASTDEVRVILED